VRSVDREAASLLSCELLASAISFGSPHSAPGGTAEQCDCRNLFRKLRLHRVWNHAGLVSPRQQLSHRFAAARAEVERPVVDVHPHELIGPLAVKVAAVALRIV